MFAPQAQRVFDDTAAFHTSNHVFDPHTNTTNAAVRRVFVHGQCTTTGLFRGLLLQHPRHGKALKAPVVIEDAIWWQAIVFLVSKAFIMPLPFIRRAETTNTAIFGNEHHLFDGMVLVLPTIGECLFISIGWSIYGSFGSIMEKRGRSAGAAREVATWFPLDKRAVRWSRYPAAASA